MRLDCNFLRFVPAALAARAEIQGIVVKGALPTGSIRRALDRLMPQLNACYARAAKAATRQNSSPMRCA